ncbi:MAG: DUF4244 domain-containing protein [Acidimicrobiia bacterium]
MTSRVAIAHARLTGLLADDHAERERGQATTEYALVLLGAAAVALLLIAWATAGGGAGRIGALLDRIMDSITDRVV